jgi:hypothetical protein
MLKWTESNQNQSFSKSFALLLILGLLLIHGVGWLSVRLENAGGRGELCAFRSIIVARSLSLSLLHSSRLRAASHALVNLSFSRTPIVVLYSQCVPLGEGLALLDRTSMVCGTAMELAELFRSSPTCALVVGSHSQYEVLRSCTLGRRPPGEIEPTWRSPRTTP